MKEPPDSIDCIFTSIQGYLHLHNTAHDIAIKMTVHYIVHNKLLSILLGSHNIREMRSCLHFGKVVDIELQVNTVIVHYMSEKLSTLLISSRCFCSHCVPGPLHSSCMQHIARFIYELSKPQSDSSSLLP